MAIESFLDRLQRSNTLDDIQTLVTDLRDDLDVEHAIYHIVGGTGSEYGALTYDPEWVQRYISNQYYKIDPVVDGALRSTGPLDWRRLDWRKAPARNLIGEAVSEGVGNQGYSIPIRGAGGQIALFSVTSYDSEDRWDKFGSAHLRDLVLAGYFLHQQVTDIMQTGEQVNTPSLTPRERDVLTLLSVGKSRSQAAETLAISEHTLKAYLDTARQKLGAFNTTHAVATALVHGLIIP